MDSLPNPAHGSASTKPAYLPTSPARMEHKLMWRVLHLGFWMSAISVLMFAAAYARRGLWLLAVAEASSIAVMSVGYGLALKRGRPMDGLRVIAVAAWLLLVVVIVAHGGLRSPAVAWIILLAPLLILAGVRLALAMTLATALLMAALYVAEVQGWLPTYQEVPLAQRAISAAMISGLFAVFAWYAMSWRMRLAEELEIARDAAIEGVRLKDRFIANLNHEIRTPMNALVAGVQLLSRQPLGADQRSLVQAMQHSADHLLALVNDVLDHARLEAAQVHIDAVEFSLRALVESAVGIFNALARGKQIDLTLEVAPELHDLWIGDPTRLRQVLANLLSNAVKFTPAQGRVTLGVASTTAPGGGHAVCFEVRDSGPGIAPELRARLFQPFEQGDTSITRRFGGTGLGLSICKDLLSLMNGTIEVESRPGAGSCFRVVVPLRRVAHDPDRPPQGLVADRVTMPAGLRVMLVEDDAVNRMVMEAVLCDMGVHVLTAEGGQQALALMHTEPVDLVLMDCQMPGMDGLSATRRWRDVEASLQRRRVPIVALTGEAQSGARAACLAAGMDDYLTKPVSAADLRRMLARWARPAAANEEAASPTG